MVGGISFFFFFLLLIFLFYFFSLIFYQIYLERTSLLPEDVNQNSIRLLSNGNLHLDFDKSRDIIISPSLTNFAKESAGKYFFNERDILASFKGLIRDEWRHSHGIFIYLFV